MPSKASIDENTSENQTQVVQAAHSMAISLSGRAMPHLLPIHTSEVHSLFYRSADTLMLLAIMPWCAANACAICCPRPPQEEPLPCKGRPSAAAAPPQPDDPFHDDWLCW